MADEEILAVARERLASEDQKHVPLYFRTTFEAALADADRDKRRYLAKAEERLLSQRGRKGGQAKKTDALQTFIIEIARQCPEVTCPLLLARLRDQAPIPPIIEVDGDTIYFTSRGGREGTAKISGLKDRLSRAKKTLNSL